MSLLQKSEACYKNNGVNLEPIEIPLIVIDDEDKKKYKDVTVKLIPLTRPQIKEFYNAVEEVEDEETGKKTVKTTKDGDAELIKKHMIEPSFSDTELKFLRPKMTRNLVYTILKASEQNIDGILKIAETVNESKSE